MDGDYVARLLMGSAGLDFGVPGLDSGFFDTLLGGGGGFGDRAAAGMPGFGGSGPFGVAEGSCGGGSGGELGAASREGSSVSDPAWAYGGANAKKRKAPAAGKGKEAASCFAKVGTKASASIWFFFCWRKFCLALLVGCLVRAVDDAVFVVCRLVTRRGRTRRNAKLRRR